TSPPGQGSVKPRGPAPRGRARASAAIITPRPASKPAGARRPSTRRRARSASTLGPVGHALLVDLARLIEDAVVAEHRRAGLAGDVVLEEAHAPLGRGEVVDVGDPRAGDVAEAPPRRAVDVARLLL